MHGFVLFSASAISVLRVCAVLGSCLWAVASVAAIISSTAKDNLRASTSSSTGVSCQWLRFTINFLWSSVGLDWVPLTWRVLNFLICLSFVSW